ncbi:MAG: 3-deoxy-manno-octulosonate cytidylyltransferase [Thermoguttaceae bacterium]|nr:3-deoxy-manno-octulosonate cytidylyltransferase [Thermoguttaceae bacterium]
MDPSIPESVIIIPARLASTRLPNKLLLDQTGKPLIQYAWESACRSALARQVIIACDHEKIYEAAKRFGADVRYTDPNAACGTDRIAEVAETLDAEIIVNVQGDEPLLAPESIDRLIRLLASDPAASMATLATPIREEAILKDPACVKVVFDRHGRALYFSRSPIPYPRAGAAAYLNAPEPVFFLHLGIYAYRRDFLLSYRSMPKSTVEKIESLEQLRALDNGHTILVDVVQERSVGIDTPEDYRRFKEYCRTH